MHQLCYATSVDSEGSTEETVDKPKMLVIYSWGRLFLAPLLIALRLIPGSHWTLERRAFKVHVRIVSVSRSHPTTLLLFLVFVSVSSFSHFDTRY